MTAAHIAQHATVKALIAMALDEDIGTGDVTTLSLVSEAAAVTADLLAREACVVAGMPVAAAVFEQVDSRIENRILVREGQKATPGEVIMTLSGPARGILTAERTALNFAQRLTGIATLTRRFVDAVGSGKVAILDTRKTTPGYRALEKYAVRCGGGTNHRMGLYDRVLIKDNHRRLWGGGDPLSLDAAIRAARERFPGTPVEIEVENETELRAALSENPEWVLLDNMSAGQIRQCVEICDGRSKLEASGGITMQTAAAIGETGVDAISLGCLTHSAPAIDLSLEVRGMM